MLPCLVLLLQCLDLLAASSALPARFDVRALDDYFAARVSRTNLVGLSVALVQDGQVVLTKGYGHRSLEDDLPVETDTRFAIGSITKQFTCACILLLAEDGKLAVTDPVASYYPELTHARDITLLDLMNHVSGYRDYYPLDFLDRRLQQPVAPDELLRQYAGGALDFDPGTRWSYSNTGFILLGRVIEKVSGEPFGTFLRRRILDPLQMGDTTCGPDPANSQVARGYTRFALSLPEAVSAEADGWLGAAGAIWSTPGDLAKWDLALVDGRLLQPASLELLTRRRALADGSLRDYGCGLTLRHQDGRLVWSHNGSVSGFNASSDLARRGTCRCSRRASVAGWK